MATSDKTTNKSPTKFSVWPSPERSWSDVKDLAVYADTNHWYSLWYADHFMPNHEGSATQDGNVYECWSMIAAIAAVTERLRVGSLVSPTTFRHPTILANTAATIDQISRGRLTLGIGAGWQVNEHLAYGVDLLEGKDRVDRFEEAIQIIKSMLTHNQTSFAGQHFSITDAPCQPQPVQTPLPIMVGTGGPRMSKITARFADEWNTWGHVSTATERVATFAQACQKVDRDWNDIHKSVQAMFFLVDDQDTIEKIRKVAPNDRSIIGSNEYIIDQIGQLIGLGFDEIIFPDFTLGKDAQTRLDSYEKIRTEILNHF
jgi:alkanesulfonate monooxygenase SsuD/methylene tetrahydromethanopterin reductase-like flavin-dependent oxidoreductase (luciferase family)